MDIFEAEMVRRFVVAVEKIANALDRKDEPQRDTPTLTAEDWKKIKTAMPESRLILFDDNGNAFEPQAETKTETQNSNLTFEKVMEETQAQVIEFPDTHQKFIFTRKIEMDGDSIKICGWEYEGVKAGERECE